MEYHPYPCAAPDPTVRPTLLYHIGQAGLSNGIPPITLCGPRSHCPSYPTVPCRIGGTSNGIPPIPLCGPRSHCPSYPTVQCRTGGTVQWNTTHTPVLPQIPLSYTTKAQTEASTTVKAGWVCHTFCHVELLIGQLSYKQKADIYVSHGYDTAKKKFSTVEKEKEARKQPPHGYVYMFAWLCFKLS